MKKFTKWINRFLPENVATTAYTGFKQLIKQKWHFLQFNTRGGGDTFTLPEEAIEEDLLPSLLRYLDTPCILTNMLPDYDEVQD